MRTTPRRRRNIRRHLLWIIEPLFRHSYSRDAYILRGVGRHIGPVFHVTDPPQATASPPPRTTGEPLHR